MQPPSWTYGAHWAHPWFGGPFLILLCIGLIAGGIWLVRGGSPFQFRRGRAADILAERYARGELTSEEYRERLEHLSM